MKDLVDSLYQRAEAKLGQRASLSPEQFAALSPAQAQRRLHDLQVHQVELEMQNEELRRTQAALDTSRAHYFDFYDLAPVGYCTVSAKGLIKEVNLATCTQLNVPRSQLSKRPISSFIFNDDQGIYYNFRHKLVDTDQPLSCELRLLKRGGTPFWAHLLVSAVPDGDGGSELRMVISDITERKQAEAKLLVSKTQAELSNNAKSRFLAAVSHDLRQPLAALTLYVDLLDAHANTHADFSQLIPRIKNCADNLGLLLGNLLDLSKLQAGAMVPTRTSVPVQGMLDALQSVHAAQAAQKGLQLRVRPCALTIRTDHTLMLRLLGNLVANAVQHTSRGGVLIAFRRHAQSQWFTVYDTGIGIAGDKIESIFDEFSQVTRNSGSGLGLYIVAKTAELLGLQVRVRSVVGRGSMFAVELPVADPTADLILSTRQSSTAPGHARLRVALVDDNTEVLQALTLALEQMGHDVVWATTGMDVIARLDGHAPDLIVTDYHLADGETGADVIEDARAIFGEDLPAVIITADTNKHELSRSVLGGIIVLYKPVQMEALRAAIAEVTG
jgi:PAS domain S-box-containing protein